MPTHVELNETESKLVQTQEPLRLGWPDRHKNLYSGKLAVLTAGYMRAQPTNAWLSQTITLPDTLENPPRRVILYGWSKIEQLFGGQLLYELRLDIRYKRQQNENRTEHKYSHTQQSAAFQTDVFGWQYVSTSLCLNDQLDDMKPDQITVNVAFRAFRGSIYVDDFGVLLQDRTGNFIVN